ncbi:hypothetical protein Sgleb_59390 [Streptomyces glebosus]|uniref:Uncharacterized protein n=1 Tax=Streptomyces glebosus TaxID=249580 RepID=A0A640T4E1_9ACTN|nr:hypothetical protein Sgleb_59390 [Streptomyces glebosus]GHG47248.1 hypothetical protein GCM10010513_03590 [Streptomyces glebosus]
MGDDAVSLDLSNYELRWPTSLFVSEGERILRTASDDRAWQDRAIWLMTEALAGTTVVADFKEADDWQTDAWATARSAGPDKTAWFAELINRASELRHSVAPRPYWPQRHGRGLSHDGTARRVPGATLHGSSTNSPTTGTWSRCSARSASTIPVTCPTAPR